MKVKILGLMLIVIMVFSCKKEKSVTNSSTATHQLTFKVGGFSQTSGGFQTNAIQSAALSDQIKVIYYDAYDASGNIVTGKTQYSSDADFGTIKDKLKNGTYTIVIVGGQSTLTGGLITLNKSYIEYENSSNSDFAKFGDTFFKKFTLTVANSSTTQTVNLDRIVAGLQVNVEDNIPSGAYNFRITFKDYYKFSYSTSLPELALDQSPDGYISNNTVFVLKSTDKGVPNVKFTVLALNTISPFSVDIACYSSDNKVIYGEKIIDNVTCQANKTTILTGKLFGGGSGTNGNFTAHVDTAWNPISINIPF